MDEERLNLIAVVAPPNCYCRELLAEVRRLVEETENQADYIASLCRENAELRAHLDNAP